MIGVLHRRQGATVSTSGKLRTVELFQAFVWTCEECGQDNYERAVRISPESIDLENLPAGSFEEAESIREFLLQGGEGDFLQAPQHVRCRECSAEFDADPL